MEARPASRCESGDTAASPAQPAAAPGPPITRPSVAFLLAHPAHFIALGFGSGLSRWAPGTAGTLWAWLAFMALQRWLTPQQIAWVVVLANLVADLLAAILDPRVRYG